MKTASLFGLLAAIALLAGTAVIVTVGPAKAWPKYTESTGKDCGVCHANGAGGGKLTADGEKFKANGHKF